MVAVLDDEASLRVALRRLLRAHGFEVTLFEDGPSLLAAHSRHPFGCILLDLHLPGMNGFAVLERLAAPPPPPVVVITGHDLEACADRVLQLGARACLAKPVEETPLLEAIGSVLKRGMAAPGSSP